MEHGRQVGVGNCHSALFYSVFFFPSYDEYCCTNMNSVQTSDDYTYCGRRMKRGRGGGVGVVVIHACQCQYIVVMDDALPSVASQQRPDGGAMRPEFFTGPGFVSQRMMRTAAAMISMLYRPSLRCMYSTPNRFVACCVGHSPGTGSTKVAHEGQRAWLLGGGGGGGLLQT